MLQQKILAIGKYLQEHWCSYCFLRIVLITVSIGIFILQIIYTIAFNTKHNDYFIKNDHYLIRLPSDGLKLRQFDDTCCQYFNYLDENDVRTINGQDKLMTVISLILSFFGASLFSVWASFVNIRGQIGSYVTVTMASILLGQFSLMRTVIFYGESCIECSGLQWLMVKPQLYPYIGLFFFVFGCVLIAIYSQTDFQANPLIYYLFIFLALVFSGVWLVCTGLTAVNSVLGAFLVTEIILDFFCMCEAYYEFIKKREEYGEENQGCCSWLQSLCDVRWPC